MAQNSYYALIKVDHTLLCCSSLAYMFNKLVSEAGWQNSPMLNKSFSMAGALGMTKAYEITWYKLEHTLKCSLRQLKMLQKSVSGVGLQWYALDYTLLCGLICYRNWYPKILCGTQIQWTRVSV